MCECPQRMYYAEGILYLATGGARPGLSSCGQATMRPLQQGIKTYCVLQGDGTVTTGGVRYESVRKLQSTQLQACCGLATRWPSWWR